MGALEVVGSMKARARARGAAREATERTRERDALGSKRRRLAARAREMETFRRSVVIARADAREPNEALESRWSGAGKVGMAGFDSAPGFASFSWMSDEEYEYYESTHEHEDAEDEEDEHEEDDSADIQSFDGTTTAESAATLKPI